MASKLIAHLAAWYIPTGRTDLDGMEGLTVDGGYLLEARRMHTELEARARGQPLMVEIEIKPVRDKRTLDQNRLMWALLNKLAQALSGGTPGGVTAEQCYLDLLADYGAEVETWRVPLKACPRCAVPTVWYRWWTCWRAGRASCGLAWAARHLTGRRCGNLLTASLTGWPKRA